ncbi:MAG: putative beta-lysine N-acetyltransferase [Chlorobiales bacterium]|nr:putative beta-lysine N-acetyltransferase [Chlorobiales bacterium]
MKDDSIEPYKGSTIQHGPKSNRVYLMKIGDSDPDELAISLKQLAEERGYTKIVAKVPASSATGFLQQRYVKEADIPGYYNGREAVLFLCLYTDPERQKLQNTDKISHNIMLAENMRDKPHPSLPEGFRLIACRPEHADAMSRLYKTVFPSYPFPIDDTVYILKTMETSIFYVGAVHDEAFAAFASAEMDVEHANVEMTDFATLPEWRGRSLAILLLEKMEQTMKNRGIKTAYTIARAVSPGMNITFARAGYTFSGTLINNTNISGSIESMNIWYKRL